jgi:hypothetical protein
MGSNTTHSDIQKRAMIEALEKSLGIVTTACKSVGIARSTHYEWYSKDKEYRKAVKSIEDIALDFAESQLHKQIQKGNPLSTIFYLKCRGKKRGYIEQQDIKVSGNMTFRADFGEGNIIHTASQSGSDT